MSDVAIVTGAAGGIGRAVAQCLVERGARVVVSDLDAAGLQETAAELGQSAVAVAADVTDPATAGLLVETATSRFGGLTILVNCAGACRDARIEKVQDELWSQMIAVNLESAFRLCRAATPIMRAAGYGRIVNVSSRAWLGGFGQAAYSAAKGGLVSMTRSLALELARDGITVNAVAPGTIDTPMFRAFRPEVQERLRTMAPAGRIGTPREVAEPIAFLASPAAAFVTGQTLHVCGGKSISSGGW